MGIIFFAVMAAVLRPIRISKAIVPAGTIHGLQEAGGKVWYASADTFRMMRIQC